MSELALALRRAGADSSQALFVDLTEVPFIDCFALRVLVERRGWLDDAGRVMPVIGEADSAVDRLLEMTRLRGRFSVFGTVGDALTAMTTVEDQAASTRRPGAIGCKTADAPAGRRSGSSTAGRPTIHRA